MTPVVKDRLLIVTGPTATGKTRRGVLIAQALGGEIVSADSRQVYRGMDIGTGKDLDEYGSTPYHMIDIVPAGYKYNLYEYLRDAKNAISAIREKGKMPIVVGGTGLYVESLAKGIVLPEVPENKSLRENLAGKSLDELTEILASMKRLHNTTDIDTPKRAIRAIEIEKFYETHPEAAMAARPVHNATVEPLIILVDIDRDARRQRISQRLKLRLDNGMVEEVKALLQDGISPDDLIYYGLEYKYITLHLINEITYEQMVSELEIAIHRFAKRQMTWFRGMERRGFQLHPLPYDMPDDEFIGQVKALMS